MKHIQEREELTLVGGGTVLVVARKVAAEVLVGESIQSSRGQSWRVREVQPTGRFVGLLTTPI